jgi:putative SOS response-associated peptidase YedK
MPDTSRRILRVEKAWNSQAALLLEVNKGELFAFAGIWDGWKNATGQWVKTCSILTTTPNALTARVHDRMPVILDPDNYDFVAQSGVNERKCHFRTAEHLRCSPHAVLSREH